MFLRASRPVRNAWNYSQELRIDPRYFPEHPYGIIWEQLFTPVALNRLDDVAHEEKLIVTWTPAANHL